MAMENLTMKLKVNTGTGIFKNQRREINVQFNHGA